MKRIRRLGIVLLISVVGVVMGLPLGSASTASALGCPNDGPIQSGLWQGFGMATGVHRACEATSIPSTSPNGNAYAGGYVALGDSVAAGLGLSPQPGADAACGVSDQAYPALVAARLHVQYQTAACSGATVGDLFTEQHLANTPRDIEPQLTSAFAGGTPSLMTITAGANDTYWQYFIRKCYVSECGTTLDKVTSAQLLAAMSAKLSYALYDIRERSVGEPPKVLVTGYYHPVSMACATQQSAFSTDEITWLNSQVDAINTVLQSVASDYPFVQFVPVDFTGHELCTANPWLQGVSDAAPVHPTARGQRTIAESVLAALSY
jgi:lysophospholipase L1-like esterase